MKSYEAATIWYGFPTFEVNMKTIVALAVLFCFGVPAFAQKVDSIYFHLYTDSLKKGQHNYINVDGKLSNGKWMPLSAKDVNFSCEAAEFSGNELIIPENFKPAKVTVRAVLKDNPAIMIERTIWIKTKPDGPLPTQQDIMENPRNRGRGRQ